GVAHSAGGGRTSRENRPRRAKPSRAPWNRSARSSPHLELDRWDEYGGVVAGGNREEVCDTGVEREGDVARVERHAHRRVDAGARAIDEEHGGSGQYDGLEIAPQQKQPAAEPRAFVAADQPRRQNLDVFADAEARAGSDHHAASASVDVPANEHPEPTGARAALREIGGVIARIDDAGAIGCVDRRAFHG